MTIKIIQIFNECRVVLDKRLSLRNLDRYLEIYISNINKAVFLKNAEKKTKYTSNLNRPKKPKKVNEDRSRFDFCTFDLAR